MPQLIPNIAGFNAWYDAQSSKLGHPPLPHDVDEYLRFIMTTFVKQALNAQNLRDYFDNIVHQGEPHTCGSRPHASRKTCPLCKEFFQQSMVISQLNEIDSVLRATS